ncbi:MAG: NADH-quinone oxidoreductase subunit J [Alphaproteobacteria bacterium]|nr:NADH-quinone oxidoreductase subunit J [Alphaproteobacteria bacterium]
MLLATLAFYLFSTVLIVAALMVVSARNPVHSVLFLILAFFNAAALFVLLGAEFLAMVLIIVYVGAVAVLFLFVVMMLDIDFVELRQGFLNYVPYGLVVGGVLLAELAIVGFGWVISPEAGAVAANPISSDTTNTEALGLVLYTKYVHVFQGAGMVLLVAMIGAIVLTHRYREGVKRQSAHQQVGRRREDAVELRKVRPGEGL